MTASHVTGTTGTARASGTLTDPVAGTETTRVVGVRVARAAPAGVGKAALIPDRESTLR